MDFTAVQEWDKDNDCTHYIKLVYNNDCTDSTRFGYNNDCTDYIKFVCNNVNQLKSHNLLGCFFLEILPFLHPSNYVLEFVHAAGLPRSKSSTSTRVCVNGAKQPAHPHMVALSPLSAFEANPK